MSFHKHTCSNDEIQGYFQEIDSTSRAGGIVAEPRNAVVVENCFATGTLYSTGNAGGIAGGLNGNNPTIKGCIAWNEQIDGEPVSGRVIGWQSNTYTKATDCYAKKDMIIAWGPNKGMTGPMLILPELMIGVQQ